MQISRNDDAGATVCLEIPVPISAFFARQTLQASHALLLVSCEPRFNCIN
jgi:hypothetical protein